MIKKEDLRVGLLLWWNNTILSVVEVKVDGFSAKTLNKKVARDPLWFDLPPERDSLPDEITVCTFKDAEKYVVGFANILQEEEHTARKNLRATERALGMYRYHTSQALAAAVITQTATTGEDGE